MENFIPPGLEARNVGTLAQIPIKDIKAMSFEDVLRKVQAGDIAEPIKIRLNLGTATTDLQLNISGNFIGAIEASSASAKVTVKFNKSQSEGTDFTKGLNILRPYGQLFFSWTAQTSAWVDFVISAYAPELFKIEDYRSEVSQAVDLSVINANTRGLNADTGTQIAKANTQSGVGTVIIHTVTAGKTLYITSVSGSKQTGATLYIAVRNGSDVEQYKIIYDNSSVAGYVTVPFLTPIKVPAGYDITLENTASATNITGQITGWEE